MASLRTSFIHTIIPRYLLLFVVFITGACVLILEITATRILSSYFGSSIYTVSSVITTILLALSIGYYIGGKYADKYPSLSFFYSIIFFSGLSVCILFLLMQFVLPILAYILPFTTGPLLISLLLFLIPNVLLGMLSPFVIKLEDIRRDTGVGTISGNVFFWSTIGSIFGSLSSGFFFIPFFGIDTIIIGTGFLLLAIGLVGVIALKGKKRIETYLGYTIGCILVIAGTLLLHALQPNKQIVYQKDGIYSQIRIYDGVYEGKPTRFFYQDKNSSGAMFLNSPRLFYDYTKYYQIYKLFDIKLTNVFVIGGAAYTIPTAFLQEDKNVHVDVAEIEPSALDTAKKYFHVPTTTRLTNYIQDGRRYLHDTNKHYDVIFSDVYSSLYAVPPHFTTKEFFTLSREKLQPDGIFIANIIGDLSIQQPSFIFSEMRTFRSVYPNSHFFAVNSPTSKKLQNIIFIGSNNDKHTTFLTHISRYKDNIFLQSLPQKYISLARVDIDHYTELTDDYAPVEYLSTRSIDTFFSH